MKIKNVAVGELRGMRYQPEGRIKNNMQELVKSIHSVGLLVPIVIDKHQNIIDGHRRVAAFKRLNLAVIPSVQYNGEMKGKKPIDVFADINTTQKKMSALQQMDVYFHGGKVSGRVAQDLRWVEENLGVDYPAKLFRHRKTPGYAVRLHSLAVRTIGEEKDGLRKFYDWALKHGVFSQLMAIEYYGHDTRCIKNAIQNDRAIKKSVVFK